MGALDALLLLLLMPWLPLLPMSLFWTATTVPPRVAAVDCVAGAAWVCGTTTTAVEAGCRDAHPEMTAAAATAARANF